MPRRVRALVSAARSACRSGQPAPCARRRSRATLRTSASATCSPAASASDNSRRTHASLCSRAHFLPSTGPAGSPARSLTQARFQQ